MHDKMNKFKDIGSYFEGKDMNLAKEINESSLWEHESKYLDRYWKIISKINK